VLAVEGPSRWREVAGMSASDLSYVFADGVAHVALRRRAPATRRLLALLGGTTNVRIWRIPDLERRGGGFRR
jgi:hypothetical protein